MLLYDALTAFVIVRKLKIYTHTRTHIDTRHSQIFHLSYIVFELHHIFTRVIEIISNTHRYND